MKMVPCRRVITLASELLTRAVSRQIFAALLALSGFSVYHQACAFQAKQEFPRLGGTKFSAPQNYDDPAVQSQLAKLDFLIVEFLPGWRGGGVAMRDAVRAIKAKNPNIVIVDYVMLGQVHNTSSGDAALRSKLEAHHWYLYAYGTGGTKVASAGGGPAFSVINHTAFVPPDAAGDRWHNWFAKYHFDRVWRHIPELDGTFTDNFFWKPRVVGDWNRDGSGADSPNNPTVGTWWRQGMMAHVNQMKALMPDKLIMGNLGGSGVSDSVNPEYQGRLHGGLLEHFIGETWSPEGVDMNGVLRAGSWKEMMDRYRKVMAMLAEPPEPRIIAFNMKGNPADLKTFRYGFASALMDNAYFDFSDGTGGNIYSPKKVPWFDEFDLAGRANTKWLGRAVDAPPTSPGNDGVYRRRFRNGMALVNPRGNGARTVTIEPGYRRFLGNQDRVVNNGNPATSITLNDRDGILLVKDDTAPTDDTVPTAPNGLTATVTSATQISLGWGPSTDNVGVTGYRVFRCTGAACVPTTMVTAVSGTAFADAGLSPGTTYGYRLRAEDAAGNLSNYSATVSATIPDPPPTTPTGLTATATSTTQIFLGWDPSTDNVGVTGYRVFRCTGAACVPTTVVAAVSGTTFVDAGLSPGTTYGYRLRAEDTAGNLSDYSATVSTTTQNPFDYSLSSGGSLTIVRGSSRSTTVTRTLVAGTAEPVVLSISGLPRGATATLTNNVCTPPCTSTLSVSTTVSTPIGTYSLTLTGTPLSKTTSLTLNVQGGVTGGLASYWPYDEGAGTSAQDASRNGWTSTLVNGTAWTADTRGQAVKFDGVNDQVHAGDIPASSAKTWVFWMKVTGHASRLQGLLDKYANGNGREWRIYLFQGALRLQMGRGAGATGYEERIATGFHAVSNAWTHVAVVFDGATGGFQVYQDGVPVATSGNFPVAAIPDTTTPVHIGYRRGGGEHFSGDLDEVRIYNRALSTTEINSLLADGGS